MSPDGARGGDEPHQQPHERIIRAADDTALIVRTWSSPSGQSRAPLILCDGLGCDGFVWRYIIERFASERPIIHVHYRGHGRSQVPVDIDTARVDVVVADMAHVLDELNVAAGIWLGHSMGVQVALESFRRLRPRVLALGLLCGSFERPIDTWHHAFFADEDAPLGNRFMRAAFGTITRTVITRWDLLAPLWKALVSSQFALDVTLSGELNPDLVKADDFKPYMRHLANMDMRVFARLARDLSEHSARDVLPLVNVPALVVGGGRDRFAPLWVSEEMHALMPPHTELLRLVQGSHTAPIEEPRLVERALMRLFARVDG